jgi:diphosphomevalonate decarboxylase
MENDLNVKLDRKQSITNIRADAKGPINIAVIKYWGKEDEENIIPLNNSISITLDMEDFYTETIAELKFKNDNENSSGEPINILFLNGKEEKINKRVLKIINYFRSLSKYKNQDLLITSKNSFPTAAGCASSASSMSCLVKVLSKVFLNEQKEIQLDDKELSRLARLGSGSACRSIFGGFVEWKKFDENYQDSIAEQIVDETYWDDLNILLMIVSDKRKDTSSTDGMKKSKETSELLKCRVEKILPQRLQEMREAIFDKNFDKLCELTIKDSNNFHIVCRDTYPPINYLNDTSNFIIRCVEKINEFFNKFICAYTFDAGPNAFIIVQKKNTQMLLNYFNKIFFDIEEKFENLKISDNGITDDESSLEPLFEELINYRDSINAIVKEIKKFEIGKGAQ